jgi:phosphotransferase family enzyme
VSRLATEWLRAEALDPRSSAAVRAELPGLDAAFDEARTNALLRKALRCDDSGTRFVRRQAVYVPGESAIVRYAAAGSLDPGEPSLPAIVSVRVFPSSELAGSHLASPLEGLAARAAARRRRAPSSSVAALLPQLAGTASVFPVDGDLPTLVDATDGLTAMSVLGDAFKETGRSVPGTRCEVGLEHYGRRHRCVLRYDLSLNGSASEPVATVYGKVACDDRGEAASATLEALTGVPGLERYVRVPQTLGYVHDLRLALMEPVPGTTAIASQLRDATGDARAIPRSNGVESSITAAGHLAAAMHGSGVGSDTIRNAHGELGELAAAARVLRRCSPLLGDAFSGWAEEVALLEASTISMPPGFSHGDFTHSQLLFDGTRFALVDFDTVCRAEPALDVGQFLAYLRMAVRKQTGPSPGGSELAERLGTRFLDAYNETAGLDEGRRSDLVARAHVYELVSLLRIAFHGWLKFKPKRVELALGLIQERLAAWGVPAT